MRGTPTTEWESLIVGFDPEADPEQLMANPQNAWLHPARQQEGLFAVLDGVGWWDAVKVNVETGHVVDGHARIILALRHRQRRVPVLYVRMTPEQERIALAENNYLAQGAVVDPASLEALLADVRADGLLDELPLLAGVVDQLSAAFNLLPGLPELEEHPLAPERPFMSGADPEAPVQEAMRELPVDTRDSLSALAGQRTAIPRREVSRPMRIFEERGWLVGPVLDYGAGNDQHSYPRFDPAYAPDYSVFAQRWRTITVNYVLNVLPLEHNRVELLAAVRGLLEPGGSVFVSIWDRSGPEALSHRGYQAAWDPERWERLFRLIFPVVHRLDVEDVWCWQLRPGAHWWQPVTG